MGSEPEARSTGHCDNGVIVRGWLAVLQQGGRRVRAGSPQYREIMVVRSGVVCHGVGWN